MAPRKSAPRFHRARKRPDRLDGRHSTSVREAVPCDGKNARTETHSVSDRTLLARYQTKPDLAPLNELLLRYTAIVYATCHRHAKDRVLSEEAAQATFIVFWQKARTLHRTTDLANWFCRAATYTVANVMKTEARRRYHEAKAAVRGKQERGQERGSTQDKTRDALSTALRDLPDADRSLLLMRYSQRRSFKTIAGVLGITEDGARMRTARALKRARGMLKPEDLPVFALLFGNAALASSSGAKVALAAGSAGTSANASPAFSTAAGATGGVAKAGIGLAAAVTMIASSFALGHWHGVNGKAPETARVAAPKPEPKPAADVKTIRFEDAMIQTYGGSQDQSAITMVEDDGATLRIVGNGWKKIHFPYAVTPYTVLEFDFSSSVMGEVQGIGFDTDDGISANRTFKLYGTQRWGNTDYSDYDATAPGVKRYRIHVGRHFTGVFSYLIIANDYDARDVLVDSAYSNIRVYEATPRYQPESVPGSEDRIELGPMVRDDKGRMMSRL